MTEAADRGMPERSCIENARGGISDDAVVNQKKTKDKQSVFFPRQLYILKGEKGMEEGDNRELEAEASISRYLPSAHGDITRITHNTLHTREHTVYTKRETQNKKKETIDYSTK